MDVYGETEIYRIIGIISTLVPELHNIRVEILDGAIKNALQRVPPLEIDEDYEFKEERILLLNYINELEEQLNKIKEELEDAWTKEK